MGSRFDDAETTRRVRIAQERYNALINRRVDLLCAHLRDRSQDFAEFAREYRSQSSIAHDVPIRSQGQDLEYACPRLRNRNRNTWATVLSRLFYYEGEQYAKLKALSPFASVQLVELGAGTTGAYPTLSLTGSRDDVLAAHHLIETGKARFRKIAGTNIYVVSKAKYAPVKDSRDFRDG